MCSLMKRALHLLITSLLLSLGAAVHGQSLRTDSTALAPRQSQGYIEQFVRRGLESNEELKAARAEVEAARARLRQAGLLPDPSVEVSKRQSNDGMDSNTMIGLSVPLEVMGTRSSRITVAKLELALKELGLQTMEQDLAVRIRKGYSNAAALSQQLQFLRTNISAAKEALNLTQAGVTEGKIAPLSESMESVELNQMLAMQERAESELAMALSTLRTAIGLKPDEPIELGSLDPSVVDQPLSVASAKSLSNDRRLELRGARLIESLANARVSLARANGRPEVEVTAGYESGKSAFPLKGLNGSGVPVPIEKEMKMFSFGLRFTLPVTNGNRGEIAAARSEAEAARLRREFGEKATGNEVVAAVARFERLRRAVELTRVGVVEPSRRNVTVSREAQRLGALSLNEFLSLQRQQIEAETKLVELVRDLLDAETDYLRIIGSDRLIGR